MPSQDDKQEVADLQRLNENLSQSLEHCRELLAQCRSQLAANSNETAAFREDSDARLG